MSELRVGHIESKITKLTALNCCISVVPFDRKASFDV
jgi:hypothetical protein